MWIRVLLLLASASAEWSFREFFGGEWTLERTRSGVVTRAHYSLNASSDGSLEGAYYEEGEEPTNLMRVRVTFEDSTGRKGQFQLAKIKQVEPEPWEGEDGEDPPVPVPVQQPEPKTVFEFDFTPQVDERFWISESRCMCPGIDRWDAATFPR